MSLENTLTLLKVLKELSALSSKDQSSLLYALDDRRSGEFELEEPLDDYNNHVKYTLSDSGDLDVTVFYKSRK